MISSVRPGDPTRLGVQRFNPEQDRFEILEVEVVLGELDLLMASPAGINLRRLGLERLRTATVEQARQAGVPFVRGALLIAVGVDSRLGRDFPTGTIITEVDGRNISSADEMLARLDRAQAAGRDIVLLGVRPDGESRRLELVLSIR
jgi:S1-C subfamily serine protease